MEDRKITLRMGPEEGRAMDTFLEEHSEFENQSHLIRTALKTYMDRDAHSTSSKTTGSGIFVRFTKTELETLRTIAEREDCLDEADFVRNHVRLIYTTPVEKGQYTDARLVARDVPL
ncbi:MAG: hypothetical protein LBE48_00090 [Methanomassiliicoccaceae archaeon]|jgi:Arc/MetJ-type ribon-helix-helix transcriptional regulator|nr:hypothetical protein [Methanomassiliicoccaceae archaeon]